MAGSAVLNGTSAYGIYTAAAFFTTLPVTICGWGKSAAGQARDFFGLASSGNNSIFNYIRQHNDAAAAYRNSAFLAIGGTFVHDDATWNSIVGVFTTTDTKIYVGGVLEATDTNDDVARSFDAMMVGAVPTVPTDFFAGSVSHLSIHSAEFTLSDAQRHAAGISADQLPSTFAWYKLETDGVDTVGGRNLTLTDVTFDADGPVIVYPSADERDAFARSPTRSIITGPSDRPRFLKGRR